jgi:hypothetical protein
VSGDTVEVVASDGTTYTIRRLSWGEYAATEAPLQRGDVTAHRMALGAACTGLDVADYAALDFETGRRIEAAVYRLHPPLAEALDDAGEL